MTLILRRGEYRSLWECRRIHPITVSGRRWLAVLRVGPWSLILCERATP